MSDSYLSAERSTTKSFQGNKVPDTAVAAAAAGLGITLTSLWGCRAEIERGDLIRIIEDWAMEPVEAHALFPPGRAASPAALAFIDYLAPQRRRGGRIDRSPRRRLLICDRGNKQRGKALAGISHRRAAS